jgi:TATA-binding protein-associated factor Taf7
MLCAQQTVQAEDQHRAPPPPPPRGLGPSPPPVPAARPQKARAATVEEPVLHRPSSGPSRRTHHGGPSTKRDEPDLRRAEQLLKTLPKGRHEGGTCAYCRRRRARERAREREEEEEDEDEGYGEGEDDDEEVLPPQTVLARALRELEDDFAQHKRLVAFF